MSQTVILKYTTYFCENGNVTSKSRVEYPQTQNDLVFTLAILRQRAQIFHHHSNISLFIDDKWYYGAI